MRRTESMTRDELERHRVPSRIDEEELTSWDIRQRAFSGMTAIAFRGVLVRVFAFAANVVLARLLAPADFGVVALGLTVVAFGSFVGNAGLGAALIKRTEAPTRSELEAVLGVQLAIAAIFVGLVVAIGVPLGRIGAVAAV